MCNKYQIPVLDKIVALVTFVGVIQKKIGTPDTERSWFFTPKPGKPETLEDIGMTAEEVEKILPSIEWLRGGDLAIAAVKEPEKHKLDPALRAFDTFTQLIMQEPEKWPPFIALMGALGAVRKIAVERYKNMRVKVLGLHEPDGLLQRMKETMAKAEQHDEALKAKFGSRPVEKSAAAPVAAKVVAAVAKAAVTATKPTMKANELAAMLAGLEEKEAAEAKAKAERERRVIDVSRRIREACEKAGHAEKMSLPWIAQENRKSARIMVAELRRFAPEANWMDTVKADAVLLREFAYGKDQPAAVSTEEIDRRWLAIAEAEELLDEKPSVVRANAPERPPRYGECRKETFDKKKKPDGTKGKKKGGGEKKGNGGDKGGGGGGQNVDRKAAKNAAKAAARAA